MKKILFVIAVAACWFGVQRYLRQRGEAQIARMEDANLREGMTIGDLRQALGSPTSTSDGFEWAGGLVTAKSKSGDETSEATEIKVTAQFPGKLRGQDVEAYKRMPGIQRGRQFWVELGEASGGDKWFAVWEPDATPEHHVHTVALTRARQ